MLNNNSPANAAAEMLKAYEEVESRRQGVANLKSPVIVPGLSLPEHVAVYNRLLINICSVSQNPSCAHPGFRILGAFESDSDLEEHVQTFYQKSDCALHKAYQGHTTILCRKIEDQLNAQYVTSRRDEIVRWHLQKNAEELEEFKRQYEEKRPGKINQSLAALKAEARKKARKSTTRLQAYKTTVERKLKTGQGQRVRPVPRDAELRGQNVAVIDVFDDPDPAAWKGRLVPEPLVTIWGVFPDDAEAEKFMEYWATAAEMKSRHMYIVPCYEFIYPESKDLFEMKEKSRNVEENKIIQRRKQEKTDIQQYTNSVGLKLPEENQKYDPENPNFRAKVLDQKGNELLVSKNEPLPDKEPKTKFPVVPKDDADFAAPYAAVPNVQNVSSLATPTPPGGAQAQPPPSPFFNRPLAPARSSS